MGERILRGSRLGAVSYETDRGTELAPRQTASYDCPGGHQFTMPFAAEAEVPAVWECKVCGAPSVIVDGERPEPKKSKPPRTHWDMLMERRTTDDLEEVLAERLAVLRGDPTPERRSA
jgi:rubredoxin